MVWTKSNDLANLKEKSQEANCGPLSEMTSHGILWRANMILSCWMTSAEVSFGRRAISI